MGRSALAHMWNHVQAADDKPVQQTNLSHDSETSHGTSCLHYHPGHPSRLLLSLSPSTMLMRCTSTSLRSLSCPSERIGERRTVEQPQSDSGDYISIDEQPSASSSAKTPTTSSTLGSGEDVGVKEKVARPCAKMSDDSHSREQPSTARSVLVHRSR